jgi:hypothetical protein
MALDDTSDPSHFFRDQDLIHELRKDGGPLSLRAAERLAWLRENMIDPGEYMRVSNERVQLMGLLDRVGK